MRTLPNLTQYSADEPPEAPEPPDYSGIDLELRYACSRCGDTVNELGCPDHKGAPVERIDSE